MNAAFGFLFAPPRFAVLRVAFFALFRPPFFAPPFFFFVAVRSLLELVSGACSPMETALVGLRRANDKIPVEERNRQIGSFSL